MKCNPSISLSNAVSNSVFLLSATVCLLSLILLTVFSSITHDTERGKSLGLGHWHISPSSIAQFSSLEKETFYFAEFIYTVFIECIYFPHVRLWFLVAGLFQCCCFLAFYYFVEWMEQNDSSFQFFVFLWCFVVDAWWSCINSLKSNTLESVLWRLMQFHCPKPSIWMIMLPVLLICLDQLSATWQCSFSFHMPFRRGIASQHPSQGVSTTSVFRRRLIRIALLLLARSEPSVPTPCDSSFLGFQIKVASYLVWNTETHRKYSSGFNIYLIGVISFNGYARFPVFQRILVAL